MATDNFFSLQAQGTVSAAPACAVNAQTYLAVMLFFAACFGLSASLSWVAWFARRRKRKVNVKNVKIRPPVAALLFSTEVIIVVLLAVLPYTGTATADNGVPLALMVSVGTCHFIFVYFAMRRYVQLGQQVFRFTDAELLLSTGSSSNDGSRPAQPVTAAARKLVTVKQLDAMLMWLFFIMAAGIVGDVVLAILSLALPKDPRVLRAALGVLLVQAIVTVYCVSYQLWRLYRALLGNVLEDARLRKVRRTIARIVLVVVVLGFPSTVYFALLLGPYSNAMGSTALMPLCGLVAFNHVASVVVPWLGKRKPAKAAATVPSKSAENNRTEPSSGPGAGAAASTEIFATMAVPPLSQDAGL